MSQKPPWWNPAGANIISHREPGPRDSSKSARSTVTYVTYGHAVWKLELAFSNHQNMRAAQLQVSPKESEVRSPKSAQRPTEHLESLEVLEAQKQKQLFRNTHAHVARAPHNGQALRLSDRVNLGCKSLRRSKHSSSKGF
eukprot:15436122-Alexandrium_andersonii.AAC.2